LATCVSDGFVITNAPFKSGGFLRGREFGEAIA